MNQHLEMIKKIYIKRKEILLMNCPKKVIGCFKNANLFSQIEMQIESIAEYEFSIQEFYACLIVQLTRSMEAYSLNEYCMRRFQNDYERSPQLSFRWRILFIKTELKLLINRELQLYPFIRNDAYFKAIKNLKQNIKLVSKIVMQDLTEFKIDQYCNEIQIIIVSNILGPQLQALSTYDEQQIYIQNDGFVYNDHKFIEQALVDGFYFWLIKNKNPFLIMGEINPILISQESNRQYEAGDFYINQIYGEKILNNMAFRMIRVNIL